jgi:hypothetical protein
VGEEPGVEGDGGLGHLVLQHGHRDDRLGAHRGEALSGAFAGDHDQVGHHGEGALGGLEATAGGAGREAVGVRGFVDQQGGSVAL